ncbi:hypothetical protein [Sphingomonas sp.]|uniref:hypothetical protein n=1 Tax=Sphingomonas sp. TaxID=28214 RepID=UPI001B29C28C|nr:hypothetical protein [Sphingomonas sp.]MBO9712441.1 hypothetical protein [Sphingomonas sp.]
MKNTTLKNAAGIAAMAAGIALATPALAQDSVRWSWDRTRTDTSTKVDTSTLDALPTGDMAVQAAQIYIGNVHAQADAQASIVPVSGTLLEADTLGHVEADASGYANLYTASAEVPMSVSMGQSHVGNIDPASAQVPTASDPTSTDANQAFAEARMTDSANGLFQPHDVTAHANATGIVDATASSEARGTSNAAQLELAAPPAELASADPTGGYVTNALMSADLTQLSVGRTEAHATTGVSMNNTGALGALDRPIAAATATSIGNLGTATVRIGTLDLGL